MSMFVCVCGCVCVHVVVIHCTVEVVSVIKDINGLGKPLYSIIEDTVLI